jgi:hypothetical protein
MTDDPTPEERPEDQPGATEEAEQGGPLAREEQFLDERLARLRPKEGRGEGGAAPEADAGRAPEPLERRLPPDFRRRAVAQYRRHQAADAAGPRRARDVPEAPAEDAEEPPEPPQPPPAGNWIPIGPSVLRQGQSAVRPPTSGRAVGIAVAPGGERVYVGTANGGVWRSDNAGRTWHSLMESFDLDPTTPASDSLSCGAIAIVPGNPDRVYVGTGEGDGAAFFGVGPVVSGDGGSSWVTEPVEPGSPELAGSAFYALAVDPGDPDRVVAATRKGVYRREPAPAGGFHWARKAVPGGGFATSVVVARTGAATTFYAARVGGPVASSSDGHTWAVVGAGFPTANVGRVGLAVQPTNPGVVYALVANPAQRDGGDALLNGVYRLDVADGTWRRVGGAPANLFGDPTFDPPVPGQGWYDLAVAVDPVDANRVYLGGSTVASSNQWSGSVFRCAVTVSGTTVSMTRTYIGASVHPDVHTLVFAPDDPDTLWLGCDGGVFVSNDPTGTGNVFQARNTGLATLTMNHLGQHPSEDAVLFCGTQDNGGVRFTGEEAWLFSAPGDGGFFVVNWANPYRVLSTYVGGVVRRSETGGARDSYGPTSVPLDPVQETVPARGVLFYAPIAGTPPNPAAPAEANVVAFGSVRPWISTDFGITWRSIPNGSLAVDRLDERIRSLAFASATVLYAATMLGGVYRFVRTGSGWTRTRLDTVGGGDLPPDGPVTDIAADPADPSGNSVYVTFGGNGDYRRVWHFDNTGWQQRSGPAAGDLASLLNVQANAIAVDPAAPSSLYVGCDLGVWHSTDGGASWSTFSSGLPDAAVIDLALHPGRRLLRAATHGRGVYERTLDAAPTPGVELYVRDTQLDQGRATTVDGLPDPTDPASVVRHWDGPDIKLDTPDATGAYQLPPGTDVDFLQFTDALSDDARNLATHATATITTHAYVQVHNRGVLPADNVRVMLLLADASAGLPALPAGFDAAVRGGTPIDTANWRTVGFATVNGVRPGVPKVARFDLTSDKLPRPDQLAGDDHHSLLALAHHADDPFTATETMPDRLTLGDRKAAQKSLKVVQFVGTPPAPQAPLVLRVRLNNADTEHELVTDLVADLGSHPGRIRYPGRVRMVLPRVRLDGDLLQALEGLQEAGDADDFERWAKAQRERLLDGQRGEHPYDPVFVGQQVDEIDDVLAGHVALLADDGARSVAVRGVVMAPGASHTVFLLFDRPPGFPTGLAFPVEVVQLDAERGTVLGGLSSRVELVPEPPLGDFALGRSAELPEGQG